MTGKEQRGAEDPAPGGKDEAKPPERRWALRRGVELDADLADSSGFTLAVKITDISEEGCKIRTFSAPTLARDLVHEIKITGLEPIGVYVTWVGEADAGLTFTTPLDPVTVRGLVTKSLYARLSRRLSRGQRGEDELGTLPPFPFKD